MTEHQDHLLGRQLQARYVLQRKLGEGGFGAVYEAHDLLGARQVAIKILRASLHAELEVQRRFAREARIIANLQHPGIVQLYEHGKTPDGIQWIAFERVQGETLECRVARGPLSEDEVLQLLHALLAALVEVHAQGVVHRDLTPKNILLRPSTEGVLSPCILDFGIASLRSDNTLTLSTFVSGTPRYMPPEQWRGLKYAEARSDLYSLGVIAYEALTGSLPFTANSPISWMRAHCDTPPRPLLDLLPVAQRPSALHDAIMKTLAKDPGERFSSARDFLAALS
jgi:eukaryotic-like serine/threonine-protein kinase